MARKPEKVPDNVAIERTVYIPGWGYNFLVERAEKQPWRNVKAEMSRLLERAIREEMTAEEKESGPDSLYLMAA